ncbi:MAG: asparagine--tRNA ligase, partial [Clostridia bacterium]|nr:asparagine--tRNA ligase [Clostridia bacterium]
MKMTPIKEIFADISAFDGKTVSVAGWVRTVRDSKAFGFIELNDGSCFKSTQIVFEEAKLDNYKQIAKLNVGASVRVEGKVVATPEMKQPFEIKADKIEIEGESTPDYPLQKKRHSLEFLRDIAYLRPRTNTFSAVFRVRSAAAQAIHKFFAEKGFIYVNTPLITGSDCEGAGEMFKVTTLELEDVPKTEDGKVDYSKDFFGKSANLTVSGQLNAETFALAFGKVYTFGPTFRAEVSYTARHAAEFWMIEPEIAFADLSDEMDLSRDMIKYVIAYVLETCPDDMKFFNDFIDKGLIERLTALLDADFVRLPYTE